MEYNFFLILFILLIFAVISIKADIKTRKVPNIITFSFILISFILFTLRINYLSYIDLIILLATLLVSYYIYKKEIWGAADGKILIGIFLLLTAFKDSTLFLEFILNLFIIYLISILILILIHTSKKDKMKKIKSINYNKLIFMTLLIILIFKAVFFLTLFFISEENINTYINLLLFISVLALIISLSNVINKLLEKITNKVKLTLNISIFILLFLLGGYFNFVILFIAVFIIKFIIDLVSDLAPKIKSKIKGNYNSPFTLYLFSSAIITIFIQKAIIKIILNSI